MSAIQPEHPAFAASRLVDAIGSDRFTRLCDALAGASLEDVSAVLRIITDAITKHDRTRSQLVLMRQFVESVADTGMPSRESTATPTEQPVSAQ